MKRLLLFGALATAVLVPAAAAAPTATHTLRGTVVAKDRAHHALVVARPGGKVQMLLAPGAFGRTGVGRTVVIRYTQPAGRLPLALTVSLKARVHRATVNGTIVSLVTRHAVINAGGSLLGVTLSATKAKRALASAKAGPGVGDMVKVEVEIDDHGSLGAGTVVATAAPAGQQAGSGGEMEVRGKVSKIDPATATTAGTIAVNVNGLLVPCVIPVGNTLNVKVDELIELECDLIGDPAVWTVHIAKGEDDHSGSGEHQSGSGHANSSKIETHGTIAGTFDQSSDMVTVTPKNGGAGVSCAIVPGSLARFVAGDAVKMECVRVGDKMTLKEIEKAGDNSEPKGSNNDNNGGNDDHHGDD